MYQFKGNIDYNLFFRFDKMWIENSNWAVLPPTSKAVLPVIAAHCNEDGQSYPGERTIAILAGLTDKSAREGIHGLIGFPGFDFTYYTTKLGRRSRKFTMKFPPERQKDRCFFFHKCILEGGNWLKLKPASQALYPVMRCFAYFDQDLYLELEESAEESFDRIEFEEFYKNRKWNVCKAKVDIMAEKGGITSRAAYKAFKDLEENDLIQDLGYDEEGVRRWKVFIYPARKWKASHLNQIVMKKYAYERK